MSDTLQQAIALIKSGDKAGGKRLLGQALREDPRSETAWLWMSGVVETDQQRADCLQRILAINPDNAQAKMGLAKLAAASQPAPEPPPPAYTPRRPTFEPPAEEPSSFTLPGIDPYPTEPAPIFPAGLGDESNAPGDSAFAALFSGSQEPGTWPDRLTEQDAVEEFDFFDAQGVDQPDSAPHAAPFDDASLADFFRAGGDMGAFDEPAAEPEAPFGSFGDSSGSAFSFDEPAEPDSGGMDDFLRQFGGDGEPAPLPDTLSETPGFFQQDTAQPGAFGGAFTEDAFAGAGAAAFLPEDDLGDQQAFAFDDQGNAAAALASEIASQAPVTAPAPISASDQRVWADPRSSGNRLTVVSVDGVLIANPDKGDLNQLKEQIENGDLPDEDALRDSKIIAMDKIISVSARSNDSLIRLEFQTDDGPHIETLEYSGAALRNEILAELYRMSRGKLRRRMEKPKLLSSIGAPLGLTIFVFIMTVVCFLGVLGVVNTASRELTGQLNQAQVDILSFLVTQGQTVVVVVGGLAFLGALAWLTWSLLRPAKVVVLRPKK